MERSVGRMDIRGEDGCSESWHACERPRDGNPFHNVQSTPLVSVFRVDDAEAAAWVATPAQSRVVGIDTEFMHGIQPQRIAVVSMCARSGEATLFQVLHLRDGGHR